MPHAPWHGGGTYTGANENFNPSVGYGGSGSQANNSNYNASQDLNQAMVQSAMDQIQQTVNMQNQPGGLSTTALNPNVQFGKTGKYNYIRDKMIAGTPLTEGDKVFANFYTGNLGGAGTAAGLTEYSGAMQDFKTGSPEEQAAYKEMFPNPLAVIMGGVADYIKNGTLLGQGMKAADYVGGLFSGDGKLSNAIDATIQGGKDAAGNFGTMVTDIPQIITQDMDEGVSTVRDFLGIKKNNSTDIAPSSLGDEMLNQSGVTTDDYNTMYDFPLANFLKGPGLTGDQGVNIQNLEPANPNNTMQTSQYTSQDIQNAIDYPGTVMAQTIRNLGLIK